MLDKLKGWFMEVHLKNMKNKIPYFDIKDKEEYIQLGHVLWNIFFQRFMIEEVMKGWIKTLDDFSFAYCKGMEEILKKEELYEYSLLLVRCKKGN
jgi:hypothetical protein